MQHSYAQIQGEFKVASGRTVKVGEDGSVSFGHLDGYLGPGAVFDAEEFFQAREDARRGRWRSPLHPDFVVYPAEGDSAIVVDERDGMSVWLNRSTARDDDEDLYFVVGSEYFEAHPEPKPWEEASDGEIWEFSLGCSKGQYLAEGGRFFLLPLRTPSEPGWKPASFASDFEHGRRIWPEDAS